MGERGILVTICSFISAIGNTRQPIIIFLFVNFKMHMLNEAPPKTVEAATKSEWVKVDMLKHFVFHVKCSKKRPVILFIDNDESHVQLNAITYAKDNSVVFIRLYLYRIQVLNFNP